MLPPLLQKIKSAALDILFPPICLNCQNYFGGENQLICTKCLESIKLNSASFCPVCLTRLPDNEKICHFDSPYILAAAGRYSDPILQNLIHHFKYRSFSSLGPILSNLICSYLKLINLILADCVVVPIPLHWRRERQRGFNQAELLGKLLADNFKLEMAAVLGRVKNNKPQAGFKDISERKENMKDCFEIHDADYIRGKNIVLVDDVFTSGATMNEAVRVLKSAGAKKIIALVAARA